jgi:hypothetical protein
VSKCMSCFFSEISLRREAYNPTQGASAKLWCWWHEYHVKKGHYCGKWMDMHTKGDPRRTAILLKGDGKKVARKTARY